MSTRPLRAMLAIVAGLILTGCASKAELPPQVAKDLGSLRSQLLQGKAQVQATCDAARDLTTRPQVQLEPQIKTYQDSVTKLEGVATSGRTQFATAEERTQAYFAHWEAQTQGMSKSMAEESAERRAESASSFKELSGKIGSLKAEFRPFMDKLSEVSKYLGTDGTAAGVKVVTPQVNDALFSEKAVLGKIDDVVAQIDAMTGGK